MKKTQLVIILDNTDMSTLSKNKMPVLTNNVKAYTKEQLAAEIQRLTTTNTQLITDKIETERIKVNLEADKTQLLNKKNSLVAKREKLRTEIVTLNIARPSNVLVYGYQDPFLKSTRNKLKVKRSSLFNSLKKNLQKFFTKIQYY